jgi:hypothetical protein
MEAREAGHDPCGSPVKQASISSIVRFFKEQQQTGVVHLQPQNDPTMALTTQEVHKEFVIVVSRKLIGSIHHRTFA